MAFRSGQSSDKTPIHRSKLIRILVLVLLFLAIVRIGLAAALRWWPPGGAQPPAAVAQPSATALAQSSTPRPSITPRPTATLPPDLTEILYDAFAPVLQAKVEIVWPHDNAPVATADLANITVFLLTEDGTRPVPCNAEYSVRLWRAMNTGPARPIAVGQKRMFASRGRTFPVWDFNDVEVAPARDPANRLLFYATVDGVATRHNVWVHALDARTIFPRADVPAAVIQGRPALIDGRIEILWPRDDLPPDRARTANISAYLFDPTSAKALAPGGAWTPTVRLHWSLNNDADRGAASSLPGQPRTATGANGVEFLAWDFNDVDVSPALDSLNKIHFWLSLDGELALTNIWTHGAAAPTLFPQADVPPQCE